MKKAFIGSLVGLAIVIAFDSFARVIISIYMGLDLPMISYSEYDGIWPFLITFIGGFSAFFGAMFSLTYGRTHRWVNVLSYLTLMILLRYGQIYLLTGKESLFYPITTLVLSLGGILIAWQLTSKNKPTSSDSTFQQDEPEEDPLYHEPES
ncbi:hypothetical protein [Rhodohalobacter halophilus]|uniref:hypothetical protein n=1 Tax=Rhodohalobacter halophilus TaxID=1812810 RepID=UPI00083F8548|nr:hypothetical protein [Rhodohalobacter halophilus]